MRKFAKTLYVKMERDGEITYPVADSKVTELAEQDEEIRVGVYQLVSVKTLANSSFLKD